MANKISSQGTQLQVDMVGDGSGYTSIPNLKDIPLPQAKSNFLDSTTQDSPAGYEEVVPGTKPNVEISVPMLYDPQSAVHKFLITKASALPVATLPFKWILTDAAHSEITQDGYPGFTGTANLNNFLQGTLTVRLTGQPTFPA